MLTLNILRLLSVIFLFLLLNGCGKDAKEYENASSTLKPEGYNIENSGSQQVIDDDYSAGELESLDQTGKNPLAGDTSSEEYRATYGRSTAPLNPVYFAFDSSAIDVDQLDKLNQSSVYLLENPSVQLFIEGNCDERGTADYNFALGELRAIKVKKYLSSMGVAKVRISTISYGSQSPLYLGSDEASWAKNRRADLVIP